MVKIKNSSLFLEILTEIVIFISMDFKSVWCCSMRYGIKVDIFFVECNKPENPFQNYDVAKKHKEVLRDKSLRNLKRYN